MKQARVLIVDDNRELAENICEILREQQEPAIQCHLACDGRSALAIAEAEAIDVALIDLHLPDGPGTELSQSLRSRSPFVEVVIVTGDTAVESAIDAVKTGAFSYVLKPFRGDELVETVRRALGQVQLCREREQLRSELEWSEKRHREVVEAVPAFVLALDGDERIALWNRRLEEVTGYSRRDVLGEPGGHLVGASGAERRLPLKSGGHRMVRWQKAPLVTGSERVTYAVGIDVTEEKEMLRRTLRAERLAAVGTLAAGLAHEVRNPLNSALLQLDVLNRRAAKGAPPESLRAVSDVVRAEIDRLGRLVSEFLEFARPRPLELRVTPVNELVESVLRVASAEADERGIQVERELDPAAGEVNVEPERLRQVLWNLIRNALEAMEQRGSMKLSSTAPDAAGNVRLSVEDTGPGFAEEAPIFDAFYTTKETGTGLGLAIVHRIVSEHGGVLEVASQPGQTKVTVVLPQAVARSAPAGWSVE